MTSRRHQIYLHIGPPKTATTYIQDIIWGNRKALSRQGIQLVKSNSDAHFLAALDLRDMALGGYADPRIPDAWKKLAGAALRVQSGTALISHEIFAGCNRREIQRVAADLDGADLHVVYTARDLGRQLPAVWQESLKNRSTTAWEEFLELTLDVDSSAQRRHPFWRAHDADAVLSRWSAVVPPERIHVLTAPPSGTTSPDLWSRFATAVGIDTQQLDMSVARRNSSLSRSEAEVLRLVNLALPEDVDWPAYQRQIKRRFNHIANQESLGQRTRIPERYRETVVKVSTRIQKGIAGGGYDIVGDLHDVEVLDASFGPDEALASEEVAAAAAELLAQVLLTPIMRGQDVLAQTPGEHMLGQVLDAYSETRRSIGRLIPRR